MGVRKRESAERRKEVLNSMTISKFNNCPTSPRKMRMVAELIRGKDIFLALNILKFNNKAPAIKLEKVLFSAITNWREKNKEERIEDFGLIVKSVFVDSGRQLKRLRPAPQGRGNRIRKRSNHITIILESKNAVNNTVQEEENNQEEENQE
jgi:large subunit ribosomal protein L22